VNAYMLGDQRVVLKKPIGSSRVNQNQIVNPKTTNNLRTRGRRFNSTDQTSQSDTFWYPLKRPERKHW
jgi:hypothetical protein